MAMHSLIEYRTQIYTVIIIFLILLIYDIHLNTHKDKNQLLWKKAFHLFWFQLLSIVFSFLKYSYTSLLVQHIFRLLAVLSAGIAFILLIRYIQFNQRLKKGKNGKKKEIEEK